MSSTCNWRQTLVVGLALAAVTAALYWPARHFDFVQFDDDLYVFQNDTVKAGLTWNGVVWSFVDSHVANWHPLTWISHMLDCEWFGLDAGKHHLVNLLLHSANSVLVFLLLRTMTGAFWRSALVAALFAWHPLRVESVAWISERKDLLSGFFFLLTLLAYARHARRPLTAPPGLWLRVSVIAFLLGLLCKPMLITLPIILLLLDVWPLQRVDTLNPDWRSLARLVQEKFPFFALSTLFSLITLWAQRAGGAMIPFRSEGLGARIATALAAYSGYLQKSVWPSDLSVLYLRPLSPPMLPAIAGAILLAGLTTLAIRSFRQRPYLLTGWLWFVIMLIPVCGLLQAGEQSMADRYTYLPAIGLAIIAVWGGYEPAMRPQVSRVARPGLVVVACAVLVAMAVLTRQQVAVWQNTETLMGHALRMDPDNYVAHQDLGVYYTRLGRLDEARAHRQRVRELDPALRQASPPAPVPSGAAGDVLARKPGATGE